MAQNVWYLVSTDTIRVEIFYLDIISLRVSLRVERYFFTNEPFGVIWVITFLFGVEVKILNDEM